jgi:hypothetical protein
VIDGDPPAVISLDDYEPQAAKHLGFNGNYETLCLRLRVSNSDGNLFLRILEQSIFSLTKTCAIIPPERRIALKHISFGDFNRGKVASDGIDCGLI